MSLAFSRTPELLEFRYPSSLFESPLSFGEIPYTLSTEGETSVLRVPSDQETPLRSLLAKNNGYPDFSAVDVAAFCNADAPVVSCVILLMFNDQYVLHVLIPSIIACSQGTPIEILVVHNGEHVDLTPFAQFPVYPSEFGSTVSGYNLGLSLARGTFVAIFHDDCVLDDPDWIPKMTDALQDDVVAVTPEIDTEAGLPALKAVPLVCRRDSFPGYDPHYYVGVEDVDIALDILSRGLQVRKVPVRSMHIRGMSSSLVVCDQPDVLRELFGWLFFPRPEIARIHRQAMERLVSIPRIRCVESEFRLYCLEKYGEFLAGTGYNVEGWKDQYLMRLRPYFFEPEERLAQDRGRLVEFYRGLHQFARETPACR